MRNVKDKRYMPKLETLLEREPYFVKKCQWIRYSASFITAHGYTGWGMLFVK